MLIDSGHGSHLEYNLSHVSVSVTCTDVVSNIYALVLCNAFRI